MKKKGYLSTLLVSSIALTSCGKSTNNSSIDQIQNIPLYGGSTTKEILIRTNNENQKQSSLTQKILSAFSVSNNDQLNNYHLGAHDNIYKQIKKERDRLPGIIEERYELNLFSPEVIVDFTAQATSGILDSTIPANVYASVGKAAINSSANALKGYLEHKKQAEIENIVTTLNERMSREVLLLSVQEGKFVGDRFIKDLTAGHDGQFLKDKIFKYKEEIISKTDLKSDDLDTLLKNADSNFLLNLGLSIRDSQDKSEKSAKAIIASLNQNNKLLKENLKATTDFIEKQSKVLDEINQRFDEDDQKLILNALFDPNSNVDRKDILEHPEKLEFFKKHPEQIENFKSITQEKESILKVIDFQKSAQNSLAIMKATSEIANNLNLDPDIAETISKGESITKTAMSLSSFFVTGSPVDALNSIASISSLFSKPKTDKRFELIFDHLKNIEANIGKIQKQIEVVQNKLESIELLLSYAVAKNQINTDLMVEEINQGLYRCNDISSKIKSDDAVNLTYTKLISAQFISSNSLDLCLGHLKNVFTNPLKNKAAYLSELATDFSKNGENVKAKTDAQKIAISSFNTIIAFNNESILKAYNAPIKNLLSINTLLTNTEELLNLSFLFDLTKTNTKADRFYFKNRNELSTRNSKSIDATPLLLNAKNLLEIAIIQQGLLDGYIRFEKSVDQFSNEKISNCTSNAGLVCLAASNKIYAKNMLATAIKVYAGSNFYKSWLSLAHNNPDHLNEKLKNTNMRVVWIGAGASELFSGTVLPSQFGLRDGAYIKISELEEYFPLPDLRNVEADLPIEKSNRVKILQHYRELINNEIIERNIEQILSTEDLFKYNQNKINLITKGE